MFNDEFFPTPFTVIQEMLSPLTKGIEIDGKLHKFVTDGSRMQVLEPSAGKGDICDYLCKYRTFRKENVYCIEIEPELALILEGKGYRVIDSDFLSYDGKMDFDLIVMNPPFSDGVDHVLKAWDILRNGTVICVLNAETIRNPHTAKRQLLTRLIEEHGAVKFIGAAFANAERPTNVEVCVVWLNKVTDTLNIEAPKFESDNGVLDEDFITNPLAKADIIDSLVDQYRAAEEATIQIHDLEKKKRFYMSGITRFPESDGDKKGDLNKKLAELKQEFWQYLFTETKIGRETTSSFQAKMEQFTNQAKGMSFSRRNIVLMFDIFYQNRKQILDQCVLKVFDQATKYHRENRCHTEGWKSNLSYMLNKKIVWPNCVTCEFGWRTTYYNDDFLSDLDKALCWVTGRSYGSIDRTLDTLRARCDAINNGDVNYTDPFRSTFFEIRIYQKGTIHLKFLDLKVWQDFNAHVSKNWVGQGF